MIFLDRGASSHGTHANSLPEMSADSKFPIRIFCLLQFISTSVPGDSFLMFVRDFTISTTIIYYYIQTNACVNGKCDRLCVLRSPYNVVLTFRL